MKKFKMLLISLLAVLSLGLLTACDKDKTEEEKEPEEPVTEEVTPTPTPTPAPENGDVLDGSFIEDNFDEEEQEEEINTLVQNYYATTGFDSESIVDSNYDRNGLLVVKNDAGNIGFYSLFHNKYLIKPMYVQEWLRYSVLQNNYVNFILNVFYEGEYKVYDGLGNELFTATEDTGINDLEVVYETHYDVLYCTLYVSTSYDYELYFKYLADGTVTSISDINSDALSNKPADEVDEMEFPFGSQFNSYFDLTEYGLDLYVAAGYGFYTVYDSNYNKLFTTSIPEEAESSAIITNKIYYQIFNQLPADATEFDVTYDEEKYNLRTYSVNLETGEEKEEELDYLIYSSEPYNKENSDLYYSILTIQEINADKTLGNLAQYIVDSNGVFHDKVTNMNLDAFIKIGNNYYNEVTGILYDFNLEEIAYLKYVVNEVYEEEGYFIGYYDGGYGILDSNARVVAEFVYDRIITPFDGNYVLAVKDNVYYRLNLSSNNPVELGINPTIYNENLYVFEKDGAIYFEGITQTHLSKVPASNETLSYNLYRTNNYLIGDSSSLLVEVVRVETNEVYNEETSSYEPVTTTYYEYINFVVNPLPNQAAFTELGTEVTEEVNVGLDKLDAIPFTESQGIPFHSVAHNYAWYEFTPAKKGYYTLDLPYGLGVHIYDEEGIEQSYNTYPYGYTVCLEAEETYYYYIYDNSYFDATYFEFQFALADATYPSYPLFYEGISGNLSVPAYQSLYVSYTAPYDAQYKVTNSNTGITLDFAVLTAADSYELNAGNTYTVTLTNNNSSDTTTRLTISLAPVAEQVSGESLFSALPLSSDPANPTAVDCTLHNTDTYYAYTNTTTNPQVVQLVAYDSQASTNYYKSVNVYNGSKELIDTINLVYSSTSEHYLVLPNQDLYFEFVTTSNSYSSTVNAYVEVLTSAEAATRIITNQTYTVADTKLFVVTKEDLYNTATLLSYTSSNSPVLVMFNQYGEEIVSSTSTSGSVYIMNEDGLKLDYYIFVDCSGTETTFDFDSEEADLYYVSNDSYYPFVFERTSSGINLTSTNSGNGANSTSSTFTITINADCTASFNYSVSSESNYDYLYVRVNGSSEVAVSGYDSGSKTLQLSAGDVLTFTYSKDSSNSSGSDCGYITNLVFSTNN